MHRLVLPFPHGARAVGRLTVVVLVASCWLAAVLPSTALPVAERTARTVARNTIAEHLAAFGHWGGVTNPQIGSVDRVVLGPYRLAYNVRVRPTGHVLVAADDELAAVLLYSDTHPFEPARSLEPGSIESWVVPELDNLHARVREEARRRPAGTRPDGWALSRVAREWQHFAVPEGSFKPTRKVRTSGDQAALGAPPQAAAAGTLPQAGPAPQSASLVGPLLATDWQQGSSLGMYYNNFTPAGPSCAHTLAGCVAIASAQLMKYWNWPPVGVGTTHYLRGTPFVGGTLQAYDAVLNHAYNWPLMPAALDGTSTAPQINAVAQLVADVGYAVDMDWGCSVSASFTSFAAANALATHFGYWPTTGMVDRSVVGATAFFAAVQADLDAPPPRPILMALSGTPGGHAIVIDGYQTGTANQAHVNLGWGSSYQGWYNIFDPATWFDGGTWTVSTQQIFPGIRPHNPSYTLAVSRIGNGTGLITSAPVGISCERTCWWPFDPASSVTLTAAATPGSHFVGWSGECDTGGSVVMSADRACVARFDLDDPSSLPAAVGNTGLSFTVGGAAGWFSQSAVTHSGGTAAQSGAIADNETSSMETAVAGPATLSFYWTVSSEAGYDFLSLYLDGVLYVDPVYGPRAISAGPPWALVTMTIPAGVHTVKWEYSKDTSVAWDSDAGWVDDIIVTPDPVTPVPVTTRLQPGAAVAGDPGFTLTVNGSGFVGSSTVLWNGSLRATTFVSATELQADIPSGDIAAAGIATVSVFTSGGWISNGQLFSIYTPFTDEPLQPGVTRVKARHIVELRQRIDDLRVRYGLGAFGWTDAALVAGVTAVKAAHLTELREALNAVYVAAGRVAPTYSDPAIVAGVTVITAAQIAELRVAVAAIW